MNNIKISKKANKMSLIDFQSNLDYWKENNKNELVYKGGIRVSITEMGTNKKYLQSNIPKTKMKVWMHQVLNGLISKQWTKQGDAYSVENFGQRSNDGNLYSVKTSLEFKMYNGKPQFTFSITQGPGKKTPTGAVTMITTDRSKIVTARKMLGMDEMNEVAMEISNFIENAENKAMLNGKPYNDIMPDQDGNHNIQAPAAGSTNSDEVSELRKQLILKDKQMEKINEEKEIAIKRAKQLEEEKEYEKLPDDIFRPIYLRVTKEGNKRIELKNSKKAN